MAVQIFRLRGVPEDEAEDVRLLLSEHHFEFYETPGGNWGISMPAIWLVDNDQQEAAKELIEKYQAERFRTARAEYEQSKFDGTQRTLLDAFKENPAQFVLYLAGILALIYFSTVPFLGK